MKLKPVGPPAIESGNGPRLAGRASTFDAKVKTGDVAGPIATSSGPQLFLVESRYDGPLDARAKVAIAQIKADKTPDPSSYTNRFSPADGVLATNSGWRAQAEFGPDEPVETALFDTPIGGASDPFVLDGKLGLAVVDARRDAAPDARMLDRLRLDGYAAWFAGELSKATITRNPIPLPELVPASASPTALHPASGSPGPTSPLLPGLPAPTPVKTDEFGLPLLP